MFAEANLRPNSLIRRVRNTAVVCLCLASTVLMFSQTLAQTPTQDAATFAASSEEGGQAAATASLSGVVNDAKGAALPKANVIIRSDSNGSIKTAITDATGHFSVDGLKPGSYTVEASAPGFAGSSQTVKVSGAQPGSVTLGLAVGSTTSDITVEADATGSIAAALAPMDALLSATSARTEITTAFIRNFTSPIADYGEIVNYVPGTFTTSSDGVGLGQSSTYFRGFPDGDYDIDYDGVPFYDTNTPTHHSWAFFPTQSIGSVDFDRSPGGASTIGPTPFGGSIHLLSPTLSPVNALRATFSGGSFNTFLYDLQYDSGQILPNHKLNFTTDIHHLQSHGYQSLNNQNQNAGDIKVEYKLTDSFVLTGYSGVVWVDANTPNFSATRCQMYGVPADGSYSCVLPGSTTNQLYPYTGTGINFLLTNNSDPLLYLDTQYNYYHVPTDFEYVGGHKEFGKGIVLDAKAYTYNYDNSEIYANVTTITELPSTSFPATGNSPKGTYLGLTVAPCNVAVVKKGVSALPCSVDKYNSYRKYGETSQLTQTSKFGILRAGIWYERGLTNRHQYPTDPLNGNKDQLLPNFAEKFDTDSYNPFVEYQYHALKNLDITGGVKFAYYSIGTQQFADDGKTIGNLGTGAAPGLGDPTKFISNGGTYFAALPSGSVNYRIKPNWSAYFQGATGSIVPPSKVFDFQQGATGTAIPPAVLPKQQKNTTYQGGTVLKLKYVTFDADYYHIYFDNSYSSYINPTTGEPTYFAQPPSITKGFEAEANISLTHGLGVYLNDSYTKATYTGSIAITCSPTSTPPSTACVPGTTPQYIEAVPKEQYVAQTPDAIQTEGVTYQHGAWDAAFFNKRVGKQYLDNGSYHNEYLIPAFDSANAFVNYTIRRGGRFDQTKISLSANNLFNSSAVTGVTLNNGVTGFTINANGTTYTDAFNASGFAISGQDNVSILAARSIMLSVVFGYNPKGRK
jgi:iron complex outermembrane receptor protein